MHGLRLELPHLKPAYSRDFFFFTLITGPRRSLSLKLGDTRVYEPYIRARLGTTAHFCEVVVLRLCKPKTRHGGTVHERLELLQLKPACRGGSHGNGVTATRCRHGNAE